ncbi:MAG: UDP-N-acetylmuramoyl-L-alanyl-D-glutamate--2,6-diaminopimelate ligase [Actinomycetes bacterium]
MSLGLRPNTPAREIVEVATVATARFAGAEPGSGYRVTGVTHDSRAVRPGDLYAALPGFNTHGAEFVGAAVESGASAILTDPAGADRAVRAGVPVLVVDDPRAALGGVADFIYDSPSSELLVIGITGTNGKTTTSFLVDAGLRAAGHLTGLIGTVGNRIGDDAVPSMRTTPEATDVHALLAVMRERGVTAVTMEVSSHALRLGRVDGVRFAVGAFTNLSADHLDFHTDMDDYFEAKASLFSPAHIASAVIDIDESFGRELVVRALSNGLPVTTYGLGPAGADWTVSEMQARPGGTTAQVSGPLGLQFALDVCLPGEFNVANALCAMAVLASVDVDLQLAASGIAGCDGVPGRMERVRDPDAVRDLVALVDYAHTPDAVERATVAARAGISGRVLVVLGAGGDRDSLKRPVMGELAATNSDVLFVTDDNPRSEVPEAIRAAILEGAYRVAGADVREIADRREAIRFAVAEAKTGDVILILGKGHESGQDVGGVVRPFDDRVELAQALSGSALDDSAPSPRETS